MMVFPALSVALAASVALALTPLSSTQSMALVASTAPTETAAPATGVSATPTASPSPSSVASATPGPALPAAPLATPVPDPTPTPLPSSDVAVVVPNETLAPTGRTGVNYLLSPLVVAEPTPAATVPAVEPSPTPTVEPPAAISYALTADSLAAVTETPSSIHGPYSMSTDKCSICHRSHSAKGQNLSTQPTLQSALCFTCHGGLGAQANVEEQFIGVPENNNLTRQYYRHDTVGATVTTAHISAGKNEFEGVSNRHSECGDCHNPHQVNNAVATTTPTGVAISGRLAGMSGVSVVNGAAGTAPTYPFLDGLSPESSITREYQLCFKCHSGFTTLSSNGSFGPSRYRLDQGIEFNPNNESYHPIEAPGKNTTAAMTASLAGTSPYKQWTFTTGSTIRCVNCHASSTNYNLVTPPAANGDLPMHTSKNPGILLQNYRNRELKPRGVAYDASDFALCYMCHAEAPFRNRDSNATNFREHERHVSGLSGNTTSATSIDQPGAGGGKAICAECHFRQHSTALSDQTVPQVAGPGLVSFAPNVTASSGVRSWTREETGRGSCTLTCHGKDHDRRGY